MCMFKLVQDTCSNPCKFEIRSQMVHIEKTLHLGDSTEFQIPVSPTSLPTDSPKVFFCGLQPATPNITGMCWKLISNQIQTRYDDPLTSLSPPNVTSLRLVSLFRKNEIELDNGCCRRVATSDLRPRTSDLGPRTSDLGPRTSDLGPRVSDLEPRTSDLGPRTSDLGWTSVGPRTSDLRPGTLDLGPRTSDLEPRPRTSDLGSWVSDLGPRTSDLGIRTSDLEPRTSDLGPQT